MLCSYTSPSYQVSVNRTIGPLVIMYGTKMIFYLVTMPYNIWFGTLKHSTQSIQSNISFFGIMNFVLTLISVVSSFYLFLRGRITCRSI